MRPFARSDRVAEHIKKNLAELLTEKIKDPRVKDAIITRVRPAKDLKSARIYYAISESKKNKKDAQSGFDNARGYIKRLLAERLGLRYMPDINFFYDDSFDYAAHIQQILNSIKNRVTDQN